MISDWATSRQGELNSHGASLDRVGRLRSQQAASVRHSSNSVWSRQPNQDQGELQGTLQAKTRKRRSSLLCGGLKLLRWAEGTGASAWNVLRILVEILRSSQTVQPLLETTPAAMLPNSFIVLMQRKFFRILNLEFYDGPPAGFCPTTGTMQNKCPAPSSMTVFQAGENGCQPLTQPSLLQATGTPFL